MGSIVFEENKILFVDNKIAFDCECDCVERLCRWCTNESGEVPLDLLVTISGLTSKDPISGDCEAGECESLNGEYVLTWWESPLGGSPDLPCHWTYSFTDVCGFTVISLFLEGFVDSLVAFGLTPLGITPEGFIQFSEAGTGDYDCPNLDKTWDATGQSPNRCVITGATATIEVAP